VREQDVEKASELMRQIREEEGWPLKRLWLDEEWPSWPEGW